MICPRCSGAVREDPVVRQDTEGQRARFVCVAGHSTYLDLVKLRKATVPFRRKMSRVMRRQPHLSKPRPERRGSKIRPGSSDKAQWQQRQRAAGLCPHCGRPCAPYAHCERRRLYVRDKMRKVRAERIRKLAAGG